MRKSAQFWHRRVASHADATRKPDRVALLSTLANMNARFVGKRILLTALGSPGDIRPFLAVAKELKALGHEPILASSEHYRALAGANGIEFAPIRPDRNPYAPDPDFLERVLRGDAAPARSFQEMFMPGLRESTEDLLGIAADVDAVVSHTLVAGGRLAAEVHGLSWISAVMQPMGYLSVFEPPVLGPPALAQVMRAVGPGAARAVHHVALAITRRWLRDWQTLRRELGLDSVNAHPLGAGQHSPLRSLGLFPRQLGAPQPDWPVSSRVCGFAFLREDGRQLDPFLEDFLRDGPPPVVFTLGTTAVNDPGRFYEEGIAAVSKLGIRAVLLTGAAGVDRFRAHSDQIAVVASAPHDLLFPRACLVVHQGGIGTLSEVILAGKPMVIAPFAHDQADNAWRASRLGASLTVPRSRFRADNLARLIRAMALEPRWKRAASKAQRAIQREHGARTAALHIDRAIGPSGVYVHNGGGPSATMYEAVRE